MQQIVIKDNKGLDGAGGYKLQYESLVEILKNIDSEENYNGKQLD